MKQYVSRVKDERADALYVDILRIMTVKKLYLDPDFNAQKMAETIGTDPRIISAIIQRKTGNNYSTFVNGLRLRDARKMLASARCAHHTAEDIGLMCGFRSRQSFYLAFRRTFNTTPSQYREENMKE